jgi:hypothetical protein
VIYDDDPTAGGRHRNLPRETLQEMAARMKRRPTKEQVDAIAKAVKGRTQTRDLSKVSPSRVKADLSRERIDVTVEQVAWVMAGAGR